MKNRNFSRPYTMFFAVSLESFPRKTTENLKEFRGILETSAKERDNIMSIE